MEATVEDAIITYLETFGQPQSVAAIAENVAPELERAELDATLEDLVAHKRIQRIEAGTHSNGNPTVEYAPLSFGD